MIIIAGGSGLIGSAICEHLQPHNIVMNYDITEKHERWLDAKHPLKDHNIKDPDVPSKSAFIDCARYSNPPEQFITWNAVINYFKQRKGGKIILFSSIYGHKAPDFGMYAGTEIQPTPIEYAIWKGGTEQATRYLAQKLKPWNIQVNCIAPGGVLDKHSKTFQEEYHTAYNTPMIEPKNILPVIDMLLHPDNKVNGQVIAVDGGIL